MKTVATILFLAVLATGQNIACCYAMTASCLACSESMTVEEFCNDPALSSMAADCPPPTMPSLPSLPKSKDDKRMTMYVADHQEECIGAFPTVCMLVKYSPNAEWEFLYDNIQGFNYEPGYEYELRVLVQKDPNPPADASMYRTSLIRVVNREEGEPLICCMAMTASCLACSESMTVEEFCNDPALSYMAADCQDYAPPMVPSAPQYATVVRKNMNTRTAIVTWVAPESGFDCNYDVYEVDIRTLRKRSVKPEATFRTGKNSNKWNVVARNSGETMSELTQLEPGMVYEVRITAVNTLSNVKSEPVKLRLKF